MAAEERERGMTDEANNAKHPRPGRAGGVQGQILEWAPLS